MGSDQLSKIIIGYIVDLVSFRVTLHIGIYGFDVGLNKCWGQIIDYKCLVSESASDT